MGSDFEVFLCSNAIELLIVLRGSISLDLNLTLPVGHFSETSLTKALACARTAAKGSPDPVPAIL